MNFQPTGNRVLVRRTKKPKPTLGLLLELIGPGGNDAIIVEGQILAVGPGAYDEDGDFCPTTVKPGQKVMFNARWNDFASEELKGSDCDGKGPLERPMPQWQYDKRDLHLITEGDIAGILG